MEIKIEFTPNTDGELEMAELVNHMVKDLAETCDKYNVKKLSYTHDCFKIFIKQ